MHSSTFYAGSEWMLVVVQAPPPGRIEVRDARRLYAKVCSEILDKERQVRHPVPPRGLVKDWAASSFTVCCTNRQTREPLH